MFSCCVLTVRRDLTGCRILRSRRIFPWLWDHVFNALFEALTVVKQSPSLCFINRTCCLFVNHLLPSRSHSNRMDVSYNFVFSTATKRQYGRFRSCLCHEAYPRLAYACIRLSSCWRRAPQHSFHLRGRSVLSNGRLLSGGFRLDSNSEPGACSYRL